MSEGSNRVAADLNPRHHAGKAGADAFDLGHVLAATQDRRAALRVVQNLEKLRSGKGLYAYEIGVIHAALGQLDNAFEWLSRAVSERSGWIAYLPRDPRLDALHTDPRFAGKFLAGRGKSPQEAGTST